MPGYRGHTVLSLVIGVAVYVLFLISSAWISVDIFSNAVSSYGGIFSLFAAVVLFGLWPDIDTNSVGQDIFYPLFFITDFIIILMGEYRAAAVFGLFAMLPVVGKHRGWTHTIWAALLIPSLLTAIPWMMYGRETAVGLIPYSVAGSIAFLGHIIIDGDLFK
ncbi:MAG: metal-dependent hydrolase [Fibrobacterota bacterium]